MATSVAFVEYIATQLQGAGTIRYLKLFGEYGIYCDEKLVALACDEKFFVKPTEAGRKYLGHVIEKAPYPGAKAYFQIDSKLNDKKWLGKLIRLTADELPLPKKKKKK